jgi:hypothetical protein
MLGLSLGLGLSYSPSQGGGAIIIPTWNDIANGLWMTNATWDRNVPPQPVCYARIDSHAVDMQTSTMTPGGDPLPPGLQASVSGTIIDLKVGGTLRTASVGANYGNHAGLLSGAVIRLNGGLFYQKYTGDGITQDCGGDFRTYANTEWWAQDDNQTTIFNSLEARNNAVLTFRHGYTTNASDKQITQKFRAVTVERADLTFRGAGNPWGATTPKMTAYMRHDSGSPGAGLYIAAGRTMLCDGFRYDWFFGSGEYDIEGTLRINHSQDPLQTTTRFAVQFSSPTPGASKGNGRIEVLSPYSILVLGNGIENLADVAKNITIHLSGGAWLTHGNGPSSGTVSNVGAVLEIGGNCTISPANWGGTAPACRYNGLSVTAESQVLFRFQSGSPNGRMEIGVGAAIDADLWIDPRTTTGGNLTWRFDCPVSGAGAIRFDCAGPGSAYTRLEFRATGSLGGLWYNQNGNTNSSSRCDISSGTTITVGWLRIDGAAYPAGTYSTAVLPGFVGGGTVIVLGDPPAISRILEDADPRLTEDGDTRTLE